MRNRVQHRLILSAVVLCALGVLLAWLLASSTALAFPTPGSMSPTATCAIDDIDTLHQCLRTSPQYERLVFMRDVTCRDASCCLPPLRAPRLILDGQGHRFIRMAQQRACSALEIAPGSTEITVQHLTVDEQDDGVVCQPEDPCAASIWVHGAHDIRFDAVALMHAKGSGLVVTGTQGFTFRWGSILRAGLIGLYIGPPDQVSQNIVIEYNLFADTNTNGLALQGVRGGLVQHNTFLRNHRHGMFHLCGGMGGKNDICDGGQLGLFEAEHLTVRHNTILYGNCDNCASNQIGGIELVINHGLPTLAQTVITENIIAHHTGPGIYLNRNEHADSTLTVFDNFLLDNRWDVLIPRVKRCGRGRC